MGCTIVWLPKVFCDWSIVSAPGCFYMLCLLQPLYTVEEVLSLLNKTHDPSPVFLQLLIFIVSPMWNFLIVPRLSNDSRPVWWTLQDSSISSGNLEGIVPAEKKLTTVILVLWGFGGVYSKTAWLPERRPELSTLGFLISTAAQMTVTPVTATLHQHSFVQVSKWEKLM